MPFVHQALKDRASTKQLLEPPFLTLNSFHWNPFGTSEKFKIQSENDLYPSESFNLCCRTALTWSFRLISWDIDDNDRIECDPVCNAVCIVNFAIQTNRSSRECLSAFSAEGCSRTQLSSSVTDGLRSTRTAVQHGKRHLARLLSITICDSHKQKNSLNAWAKLWLGSLNRIS